jgi:signal transduction histidine kinase
MQNRLFLIYFLSFWLAGAFAQHNVKVYDLLNELKYAKEDTLKADLYVALAREYAPLDVTKTIGKAELALIIAENRKDIKRSFDALSLLADAYQKKQDLAKASAYLTKLQQLDERKLSVYQRAILFGLEGKIYLSLENYEKAQRAFQAQLAIYEGDSKWAASLELANTYLELGQLNLAQNAIQNAISFFEKAISIHSKEGGINHRIQALNALGQAFILAKEYDKGLEKCNEALYLSESISDKALICDININVANSLYALEKFAEALNRLDIAYSYAESINSTAFIAKIKLKKGQIFKAQNQSAKAEALYKDALDISWLANNKALTRDIYEALHQYYDDRNDTKNAYFYLKGFINIRDSLNAEQQTKQYIIEKIKFETEQKEIENQRLLAQQLENQIIIQRQRTSNYILLALLLLGSGAGYLLYQKLKQKKANNDLLEKEVQRRTEQLQLSNDDLLLANRKLEQSNAELERFAYIASHDLKSPLRNIISFMNLIERKLRHSEDKDIKKYLQFVTENAQQMNVLIQDVLEFSRIDTDAQHSRMEKVDLNDTLMLAVQNLHETLVEGNGEVVTEKLPAIRGNSVHLLQLFQNVIGNGLKYNNSTHPTVKITHKILEHHIILSIEDNGIGIAPQYHEQIFEMFKRLHTKDEYKGTGIGLAICKKIVHNLGGKMWLNSEVGKGTNFYISLPNSINALPS